MVGQLKTAPFGADVTLSQMRRDAVVLIGVALALGCSGSKKTRPHRDDDDEPRAAAPSASVSSAAPIDRDDTFPVVEIEDTRVTIDGAPAGSLKMILDTNRMARVDELYTLLKQRRDGWKASHPGEPFPGLVGLRAGDDTKMVALKSVFQTSAFAGYPFVTLQSTASADRYADLSAIIPGPPDPSSEPGPPPEKILHVDASTPLKIVWKLRGEPVAEWIDPDPGAPPAPAHAERICKGWAEHGSHVNDSDGRRDEAVFHSDNASTLGAVWPILEAIASCKRRGGAPAFFISFSVN